MELNPLFLFVLFSMGYVFGLLLKNPTAGKFLIFGFAGIFIYEPVKEAGLLASALFLMGIISHHITPSAILDALPRLSLGSRSNRADRPRERQRHRKSTETTDETHQRYEEYQNRNRGEGSGESERNADEDGIHHQRGYTSRNAEYQQKKPQASTTDRTSDDLRRERERLKREKERLEAERREFDRKQREQKSPPDTRTDEEILGVCGDYTLADLKKARNAEVKRWNTSNMVNKPPHLIREAEEEAKKINLAYERLVQKFRKKE